MTYKSMALEILALYILKVYIEAGKHNQGVV